MVVYFNDFPVFSKTRDKHAEDFKVIKLLNKNELRMNLHKCEFLVHDDLPFLVFIVGSQGLKVDPKKTEALET